VRITTDAAVAGDDPALVSLLGDLQREVPGVRGVLLATADGLPLAHTFGPDGGQLEGTSTSTAAMVAATLGLGQRLAELVGTGRLQEATVRSTSGYVIVYAVGDVAVLTVLTHPGANVARVHLVAREIVKELDATIERDE
jgi:predicted regulator of Ras-like GTPase activity (Roadblock/LC7/MglB family)